MPNLRLHAAALSTLVALAGCSAAGSNAIPSLARPSERASRAYAPASNSTSHLYALSGLEPALFADQGVPPTIDDPTISVYTASQPEELVRTIGDDVFGPSAMAYGSDGTLYVAFLASNLTGAQGGAIEVFKPGATTPERVIAGSSTGISAPQAIAVGAGHIYV
ncbi:MAG: hypothetical protein JO199_13355, partial [Candidatus Eremiobacteraeota bacterium]|nr:hypothetical protein [Candidatus Eremiobacteraeota bacterium]